MKKVYITLALMLSVLTLSSCSSANKGVSKTESEDSSSSLPSVELSDEEGGETETYTMAQGFSFTVSKITPVQAFDDAAMIAPSKTTALDVDINFIELDEELTPGVVDFLIAQNHMESITKTYDLMSDFVIGKSAKGKLGATEIDTFNASITMKIKNADDETIDGEGMVYLFEHEGKLFVITSMWQKDSPQEDLQAISEIIDTMKIL